jgi:rhodanese-related sulfurtransferase
MRNRAGLITAVALAVVGSVMPLWSLAQSQPPSVANLVAQAKAEVRTIDMAAFKSALDAKRLGLIIDVREPAEYASGHIAGAINIPRGLIEFRIWSYVGSPDKVDLNKQITLYCGSGARSALAAKSLKDLKFGNVTSADMRIEDWAKARYPLAK